MFYISLGALINRNTLTVALIVLNNPGDSLASWGRIMVTREKKIGLTTRLK